MEDYYKFKDSLVCRTSIRLFRPVRSYLKKKRKFKTKLFDHKCGLQFSLWALKKSTGLHKEGEMLNLTDTHVFTLSGALVVTKKFLLVVWKLTFSQQVRCSFPCPLKSHPLSCLNLPLVFSSHPLGLFYFYSKIMFHCSPLWISLPPCVHVRVCARVCWEIHNSGKPDFF